MSLSCTELFLSSLKASRKKKKQQDIGGRAMAWE